MEVQEIWENFNLELRRYVLRKVKDESIADDIVQEIFEKVIKNIDRLNKTENLQEYLYKIARNTVVDFFRSRKLQVSGGFENSLEDGELQYEIDEKESESLNGIISKCCIKPFIDKLPEKYKDALIASDIENESQKALSERLNISYSGAKSRVQRGREKLKDLLQECCDFEHDTYGNLIQTKSENCNC